jgi:hypothetical protein
LRWVGIDEAGYGPNLGPMVMTAVVAEESAVASQREAVARSPRTIDFWSDLSATVDRAGGDPDRLWVDDSKAIYRGRRGRDRLEAACLAVVHALGSEVPSTLPGLLAALGAGTLDETELSRWSGSPGASEASSCLSTPPGLAQLLKLRPLDPPQARWRLVKVRSVVVAPARFNAELSCCGSKAEVHFGAFAALLQTVWESAADGRHTFVHSDKHGGRHYYLPALCREFPDAWIERGAEGAELSRYTMRSSRARLELSVQPEADRHDGLVALASIVSKTVRELWMDVFNRFWCAKVPGLRATAGYPADALRFRRDIAAAAACDGLDPSLWWRNK